MSDTARYGFALVCVLLLSGCRAFIPAQSTDVVPGKDVRVRVPVDVAMDLETPGFPNTRLLTGRILEVNERSLLLEVPVATVSRGDRVEALRQRVRLRSHEVLEVETRQLDWLRTGALLAFGAVVTTGVVVQQLTGDAGGSRQPSGSDSQEDGRVLWKLRIPFF